MSTTVDQRVVEMRFDNKQFESNVQTSMSTLDKLKQSLNLSGAAKGLANVGSAAKNVSFAGMASGIEVVHSKFSALEVMGITALANITNSAVNAGKRIARSLTIEPISDGFSEYELKLNSVQTIMASTGESLDTVNKYLEELNVYADKTIYSFSDMTSNIGKFTNAGVKLEDAVKAIQGISNEAAVSGANANEASRAMYNFAQALSAGSVKLIDWKSIENANMATVEFKNELIKTALELGTLAEEGGKYVSTTVDLNNKVSDAFTATSMFNESLSHQWMTTDVLVKTLGKYSDETTELGKKAFAAAQDVKTFSQLMDTLKEAVGSGWAQTWEIIFGDFEEAKQLWTSVNNVVGGFVERVSNARNNLLEGALGSNPKWEEFNKRLEQAGISTEQFESQLKKTAKSMGIDIDSIIEKNGSLIKAFQNRKLSSSLIILTLRDFAKSASAAGKATEEVTDKVEYFNDIVARTIRGEFGNGVDRINALTEAGHDAAVVQGLVNKIWERNGHTWDDCSLSAEELTDAMAELSDGELASIGYTEEQIEAFRALHEEAKKTGTPLHELLEDLYKPTGRELLIESFANIFASISKSAGAIGAAWREIFKPMTSSQLYDMIDAFNQFTKRLVLNEEQVDRLKRTFAGLFALLDIVKTIVGGGVTLAFKGLTKILDAFGMDFLDLTAGIGDALVAFRKFLFDNKLINKGFELLAVGILKAGSAIRDFVAQVLELPVVGKFVRYVTAIANAFKSFANGELSLDGLAIYLGRNLAKALKTIPEIAIQIGKDFIAGFQNGIIDSGKGIIDRIVSFCLNFVSAFAKALGVQSPSWKAYEIVVDFFQGAINAIKVMIGAVLEALGPVGEQIVKVFKGFWDFITDEQGNIDWGKIFAIGSLVGMIWTLKKLADAIGGVTGIISGLSDVFDEASDGIKRISKAVSMNLKAEALQKMAISIVILAASIWVLTTIDDPLKLWQAVGIIVILAGVLAGLAIAMDKMSESSVSFKKGEGINVEGLKQSLLQIGLALLLLAVVVKMIGNMNPDQAKQGFLGLAGLAVGILAFAAVLGKIGKTGSFKDVDKVGKMMSKLAIAMILMITVIKLASKLTAEEALKGAAFGIAFAIFVRSITTVAKSSGNNVSKVGGMILKISIAMALMVGVVKLAGLLSVDEMLKGAAFATAFVLFVKALVKTTKIGKKQQLAGIAGLVLSVSLSLMLMVGVCKLVGTLTAGEMVKGAIFVGAFVVLLKVLIKVLSVGNETQMAKVSGTILAMSLAIAILAGVAVLLGLVDIPSLAKGITAVGLLSLMMSLMIKSLKGAQNVKEAIMMMAVAVAVMAASVVALSFVDSKKLAGATAALSILMGMFALIAKCSGKIETSIGTMAIMIGVVVALAAILAVMSKLNVESTLEIAASISLLMLSLGATMKLISESGKSALEAILPLGALVIIAGVIGLLLVGLSKLNPGPSLMIAVAISTVLIALSVSALILSKIGKVSLVGVKGAAAFLALVTAAGAILGVVGGLVSLIPGAEKFLNNGIPIIEAIGNALGALIGGIIGGIGEAIAASLVPMAIDFNKFLVLMLPASIIAKQIDPSSFDSVKAMIDVFGAIAWNSLKTAIADFLIVGGDSMSQFRENGVKFFQAMKAISAEIPGSNITLPEGGFDWVSTLIDLFGKISWSSLKTAIADFLIIGGDSMSQFRENGVKFFQAMKAISAEIPGSNITLPEGGFDWVSTLIDLFGTISWSSFKTMVADMILSIADTDTITKFKNNAIDFFQAMKKISAEIPENNITLPEGGFDWVSSLIGLFDKISWSSFKTMVADMILNISDTDTMTKFKDNAIAFFQAMKELSAELGDTKINSEALSSVISAAAKLSDFQASLENVGGVIDWFTGRDDLGTFGTNIEAFATAMGTLKTAMGETGITEEVINSITNTGTALVELQEAIPTEKWLDGKVSLDEFGGKIESFGSSLSAFGTNVEGFDVIKATSVMTVAQMITNFAESLNELDTGSIYKFYDISTIGEIMSGYSDLVSTINTETLTSSVINAIRLRSLIESLSDMDNSGIEKFNPDAIGKAMGAYSESVSALNPETVSSSITSANRLRSFISSLVGLDSSGIGNFKIGSIATSMKTYSGSVSGMNYEAVSKSISIATRLKNFISNLSGVSTEGVGSFVDAINDLGTVSIEGIIEAFSGGSSALLSAGSELIESVITGIKAKQTALLNSIKTILVEALDEISSKESAFTKSGSTLITKLTSGIKDKSSLVESSARMAIAKAVTAIREYYDNFNSAGSYLADGLIRGMNARQTDVYNAGYALGQKAAQGEKDGQQSNSPSKLTIQAGKWLGEGLIIGIKKMGTSVYKAGYGIGDTAAKSMTQAVSKVSDLLDRDMDAQPTIRPVMDLTDIESGANSINRMFGNGVGFDVYGNFGAITSMMSSRNQNGESEVVSAINKLRKDLGNIGGTSYNINGITYDDGSNISEAVAALVRAARQERRI